jgi:putative ABC transport system permease protein
MWATLIRNDISRNKMMNLTIVAFILVAAMLTSLAAYLTINLAGAIDAMMRVAIAPSFMQMHTGDPQIDQVARFVDEHDEVTAWQVSEFLNIDGTDIVIDGSSLGWSVQDNGFSTQSTSFDFLVDLDGRIVDPQPGEIYVPLYYFKEGVVDVGDAVTIHEVLFTVAGFVRDAQMNAGLVSSKRFIVNQSDLDAIRPYGVSEYLISFLLEDGASYAAFEAAYLQAGLPANGPPAITYPLIRLMNAITDGIMIAVLALVAILVILVAFLCIRFSLIVKMEEDYTEIGVLKAIGLRLNRIQHLYRAKYGVLAGSACVLGFALSLLVARPLMADINLYMGRSDARWPALLAAAISAAVIFAVVMLYVNRVLGKFRSISPAQAIRFGAPEERSSAGTRLTLGRNRLLSRNVFLGCKDVVSRKRLFVTMLMVVVVSSFIMIVPANIYNTVSARSFVTYMGIGDCDMSLYLSRTQTPDVEQHAVEAAQLLARDSAVENYTVIYTRMFDMRADDGTIQRLKVDIGNHAAFPITYSKGRMPQNESEIALSKLNADDLEKTLGDHIVLVLDGRDVPLEIVGIFSDLTNGGKNAKALLDTRSGDLLTASIPVTFTDSALTDERVAYYQDLLPAVKVSSIETHITQVFGTTIAALRLASYVAIAITIILTVLVTLLFMRMLVTRDRFSIALMKSLGFTTAEITTQYLTRALLVVIAGVIIGTLLANTAGEYVGVALIALFGASSFHFVVNPLFAYVLTPVLIAGCALAATLFGISSMRKLRISDYIKEA